MRRILVLVCVMHCVGSVAWAGKSERRHSVTVSANVPHVLDLNYDVRLKPWLSVGIAGGYFGLTLHSTETGPISISTSNYEGHLRLHPFQGPFFIGVLIGHQSFSGETARVIDVPEYSTSVSLTGTVNISSNYLTPHLGWMWKWDSGFTLGFDLGWQLSFSPTTTVSIPLPDSQVSAAATSTAEYQDLMRDVQDVGNRLASVSLPFVTLLRFGWSF